MKKALYFLIPVAVCFLLGALAGMLQTDAIQHWYPYLDKPALTPPNIVFPVAWSILYLCMGLSAGFVLRSDSPRKKGLVVLFSVQLLLNFLWSVVFFYFQNPTAGLIDILVLAALTILYAVRSSRVSKTAAMLFIPYILWILFATYLNLYIVLYN